MSSLFFFDTDAALERSKVSLRSPLPTPETGWRPPRDFPNLANAYIIGRDRETREFDFDNGPGWARGKGYIVGESVTAWDRDFRPTSWYFPMRHEVEPQYNMDPAQVTAFARDVDAGPQTKLYANYLYDAGYGTDNGGSLPNGECHDVQFAEALISETDLTALSALGEKYLGEGKASNQMYEWSAANYGGNPTGKQRENIYRISPRLVGPYAEQDSAMLLPILMKQVPILREEGLYDVYRMNCDFAPLLVLMRKRGVRIDLAKAETLYQQMGDSLCADTPGTCNNYGLIAELEKKLFDMTGIWVNTESSADLAKAFDAVSVKYPRTAPTENGGGDNPSFTAEFLNNVEHPVGMLVVEIRQHKKLKSTFLKSYILDSHNNGRIHGQYHPTKGEAGGTRVGRLSSSTPNLQNIPSRTALGRQIRTMFLPDAGSLCLEKGDHSQLQYRILAHFAVDSYNHYGVISYADGPHSDALRAEYIANPHTDYHSRTQKMVQAVSGLYIPRSSEEASQGQLVCEHQPGTPEYKLAMQMVKEGAATFEFTAWHTGRFTIKETNFGLMFGMGKRKLIRQSGLAVQKGEDVFNSYHQGNPYVKATMDYFNYLAQTQGYVTTFLGQRTRFDRWVEKGFHDPPQTPLHFGQALREYGAGQIERAMTYKALCNVLQGTEGEIIKMGMLTCYREGLYDILGVPLLTTHDEVVLDIPNDSHIVRQARARARWIMANCLRLRVPLVYESTTGPNWGEAKTPIDEAIDAQYLAGWQRMSNQIG